MSGVEPVRKSTPILNKAVLEKIKCLMRAPSFIHSTDGISTKSSFSCIFSKIGHQIHILFINFSDT